MRRLLQLGQGTAALLLFVGLALLAPRRAQAAVLLTSASIQWSADDAADIYINGNYLGYSDCGGSCYKTISTVVLTPAQLAWFGPCNVIAAAAYDFASGQGFFSYTMTLLFNDGSSVNTISNGSNALEWFAGSSGGANPPQGAPTMNYPPGAWTTYAYTPGPGWFVPNVVVPSSCDSGSATPGGITGWTDCSLTQYQAFAYRQTFYLPQLGVCATPTPTKTPTSSCPGGQSVAIINSVDTGATGLGTAIGNRWGCCSTGIATGLGDCADGRYARGRGGSGGYSNWWATVPIVPPAGTISSVKVHINWMTDGYTDSNYPAGNMALLYNYAYDGAYTKPGADLSFAYANPANPFVMQSSSTTLAPPGGGWTWAQVNQLQTYLAIIRVHEAFISCLYYEVCYSSVPPSPTDTPTRTPTPTITRTPTATPTFTVTPSRTPTPTSTGTPSPTPSFTGTPSRTATATSTVSATMTPSYTQTSTRTATETSTASASPTPTPSATPSRTATATLTASASPTPSSTETGNPSATQTYTVTPTATATRTETVSSTSSTTRTSTPTATATPTETLSSTASITASATPTPTPSFTVSVTPSASATQTLWPSASPTPPPKNYYASVKVYNAAGELVATLTQQLALTQAPTGLVPQVPSFVPDQGGSGVLDLVGTGMPLVWDGKTDTGQVVDSGVYYVSVEVIDIFGKVDTFTASLSVLRTDSSTSIEVYNSAGELVWHASGIPQKPGRVGVSDQSLVPGQPGAGLKISYGSDPGDVVIWDGTGDLGQALASGTYMVKVTESGPSGKATSTYSVALLQPNTQVFGWVAAAPNPVRSGTQSVLISLQGAAPGVRAWGQVFNMAGELIGNVADESAGNLRWRIPSELASGIYILRINARDLTGKLKAASVKIAVLR